MDRKRTSISLFSGIAGLDSGLHKAGFEPIFCSEIDPNAQATLKLWLSQQRITCPVGSDVTQIDQKKAEGIYAEGRGRKKL